jgi:hypothetical protein
MSMGRWGAQVRAHAERLRATGNAGQALTVLRNLLATSPYDYEAHLELAEMISGSPDARTSAATVLRNAERPELRNRAAVLLGTPEPAPEAVPALDKDQPGLRVVLVPLPPTDVRLMQEAAKIYERITDVPVTIRGLPQEWDFGPVDRVANQNSIQQWIVQRTGYRVDFEGWKPDRYVSQLLEVAEVGDALTRFATRNYVAILRDEPGQYVVDRHIDRFLDLLAPFRLADRRTMYVGVTGANITSGTSNYLFSGYREGASGGASILSYAMMQAKQAGDGYESRPRLAERLAKEMVPASLKGLGIPRPTDPSDPYSYSDGVRRLSEKTLMLSEPTRAALDKFR